VTKPRLSDDFPLSQKSFSNSLSLDGFRKIDFSDPGGTGLTRVTTATHIVNLQLATTLVSEAGTQNPATFAGAGKTVFQRSIF
jgi:hypothetical protein